MHKNSRTSWITTLSLMLAFAALHGYAADEKTTISLTVQQVMPGSQAYVTVMLTNVPMADLSELREWIEFPKDKLSYVSSRMSIAGDLAEATLKVEVQDKSDKEQPDAKEAERKAEADQKPGEEQPDTKAAEKKEAQTPEGSDREQANERSSDTNIGVVYLTISGKRPIPDGPVAEITFKVAETLDEETITLGHRSEAVAPGGEKISELAFEKGSVKVSRETPERPPAIFSCFFYMH